MLAFACGSIARISYFMHRITQARWCRKWLDSYRGYIAADRDCRRCQHCLTAMSSAELANGLLDEVLDILFMPTIGGTNSGLSAELASSFAAFYFIVLPAGNNDPRAFMRAKARAVARTDAGESPVISTVESIAWLELSRRRKTSCGLCQPGGLCQV